MSNSSAFLNRVRVEDVASVAIAVLLLAVAGTKAALLGIHFELTKSGDWTINFFLFPIALLVFSASLRYALRLDEVAVGTTLRAIGRMFRDWSPFVLFLIFYETFQASLWKYLSGRTYDAQLLAIDRRLLGETPALTMQAITSKGLTDVMMVAYFLHLILPPVVAALWYRRDLRTFRHLLLSVIIGGAIAWIGYALVPAVGPSFALLHEFRVDLKGDLYRPLTEFFDMAAAPRDVFPSLHVGLSTIVLWFGAKRSRTWFWILLPFVLGNWISTMYLRYHYFIDVVAGWATAAFAIWLGGVLLRAEDRLKGRNAMEAVAQTP